MYLVLPIGISQSRVAALIPQWLHITIPTVTPPFFEHFSVALVVHVADSLQDGKKEPFLVFVCQLALLAAAFGS